MNEQDEAPGREWMRVSACSICEDIFPTDALPYDVVLVDANKPDEEMTGYCCEACWRALLARAGWTEPMGYKEATRE